MTEPKLYPATVAMKVFIHDDEAIKKDIIDIVKQSFPKVSDKDLSFSHSANQKYLSITFKIFVKNKQEMDTLYQKMTQHPDVKMVL
jgi:putative lipoic acid-binding regulatory protein